MAFLFAALFLSTGYLSQEAVRAQSFPTVAGTNTSNTGNNAVTDHEVSLPTGIQANDLLVVTFGIAGTQTVTFPGGWTVFGDEVNGSAVRIVTAYRQATGGEGATISVATSSAVRSAHTSYRITGHADPSVLAPEASSASTGTGDSPDPPVFSPLGGEQDYLWIAAAARRDSRNTASAPPANYANLLSDSGAGNTDGVAIMSAERQLLASSEDPGFFSTNRSGDWVALTIAVYPPEPVASETAFTQSGYRFFENQDSLDVGSPLANQNSPSTVEENEQFRLRMLIHIDEVNLAQSEENFILQFAVKGSGSCTIPDQPYANVTSVTDIAWYVNATASDGGELQVNVDDPQHTGHTIRHQTYRESHPFSNAISAVAVGEDGMWDFSLVNAGGTEGETYCLRMVKENEDPLDSYAVFPEVTIALPVVSEGHVVSSTFDTESIGGAAFNTISFSGTTPSDSRVEFQFASSDCENGADDFPDCVSGQWGEGQSAYLGPDGSSLTRYTALPGEQVLIGNEHHNRRYVRYKVILYVSGDGQSPQVEMVTINWSP